MKFVRVYYLAGSQSDLSLLLPPYELSCGAKVVTEIVKQSFGPFYASPEISESSEKMLLLRFASQTRLKAGVLYTERKFPKIEHGLNANVQDRHTRSIIRILGCESSDIQLS